MSTTQNMDLELPEVGSTSGPQWAQLINEALEKIDEHDHSDGKGVALKLEDLEVTSDFSLQDNSITDVSTAKFTAFPILPSMGLDDLNLLMSVNGDLYFRDGNGRNVKLTANGYIISAPGNISGLVGNALVQYTSGFLSLIDDDSNAPMTLRCGNVRIHAETSGGLNEGASYVSLTASGVSSSFSIILPSQLPALTKIMTMSSTGGIGFADSVPGMVPIGGVIATFPNLTGAYSCTNTTNADTHGFVICGGQTINDGLSPMDGAVIPDINNDVFLKGNNVSGTEGGSNSDRNLEHSHSVSIDHTHSDTTDALGTLSLGHNHTIAGHYHTFSQLSEYVTPASPTYRVYNGYNSRPIIYGSTQNIAGGPRADILATQIFDDRSQPDFQGELIAATVYGQYNLEALALDPNVASHRHTVSGQTTNGTSDGGSNQTSGDALGDNNLTHSHSVPSLTASVNSSNSLSTSVSIQPKYITAKYVMRIK